jgi:hypothetical protein
VPPGSWPQPRTNVERPEDSLHTVSLVASGHPHLSPRRSTDFFLGLMQAGVKHGYESIKAFSETGFTEDLKKFDIPTLVMHGEDDQIVPVKNSAKKSAKLIKGASKSTIRPVARPHRHASRPRQQRPARVLPARQTERRLNSHRGRRATRTTRALSLEGTKHGQAY